MDEEVSALTGEARRPKFTDIFVYRPVLAVVVCLLLVLGGIRAAMDLPVLQYPQIESSRLEIVTPYVGASKDIIQGYITEPIERVAASVPGVDYVDSQTTPGVSTVTVWLELNESSTDALAEMTARLNQIRFELPEGAEDPVIQVRRADRPQGAFYLDVTIPDYMTRAEVTDYLVRNVNPGLAAIPDVQRVDMPGGRLPAMRIWLQPERMAMFDVSAQDVADALTRNNFIATIGRSENTALRMDLLMESTLRGEDAFEQLIIRETEDSLIRLRDVASVELGEEEGEMSARLTQQDTVFIGIWPLPGANELAIAEHVYATLDRINKGLPQGMTISIGFDVTKYMRSALREIFITLGETVLLVGIVVVALMGSFRTALVPLITIPISLLGAVGAMAVMGFSLNLLTVLAIVLSVGLVVDDAIVVMENVARYLRQGMSRMDAALASSRQLLAPIVAMTLTLAAVYAPIGFLSGLTGFLFREFAFTLAIAVLISGVIALTLSPVMSAWVSPTGGRQGRLTRLVNQLFARTQAAYARVLASVLRANGPVLFVASFVTLLIVPFYLFSLGELAPTEDQSSINVVIEAAPDSTIDYTKQYMVDVVDVMKSLDGSTLMWQMLRGSGGFGGMEFVDFHDRERSVHEMQPEAFAKLSQISGLRTFPILPPALPTAGDFDVELVVLGPDSAEGMLPYAQQLVQKAMQSGRFMFADTSLRIDLPQARFVLDRERVADLGMDVATVSRQLGIFLSGNYVNRFDIEGKSYRVIPMVGDEGRTNPDRLLDLKLRTPEGELIPLRALASLEQLPSPRVLDRFQQSNAFRVFAGVLPGTTTEQGLQTLEQAAEEILPDTYSVDYAGESRQLRQEGNTLLGVLGVSVVVVFLALAVQFNSFRDPLVVLLGSVPLALSGALLFTFLGWTTINIYSQVGFITLVGLIAKNAILIVEFAKQLQADGYSKLEAIQRSAETRLRPVLMTTGATVMGHFPLVLVTGPGAEARNSIGIILVAGMLVGTLFTLFILPSIYLLLASTHKAEGEWANAETGKGELTAQPAV